MGAAGDEDPVRPLPQAQGSATPLGVLQRDVSPTAPGGSLLLLLLLLLSLPTEFFVSLAGK